MTPTPWPQIPGYLRRLSPTDEAQVRARFFQVLATLPSRPRANARRLIILRLGLGRDSMTILVLLCAGLLVVEGHTLFPGEVDAVVFTDPGHEWPFTYALIPRVEAFCRLFGLRFLWQKKPPADGPTGWIAWAEHQKRNRRRAEAAEAAVLQAEEAVAGPREGVAAAVLVHREWVARREEAVQQRKALRKAAQDRVNQMKEEQREERRVCKLYQPQRVAAAVALRRLQGAVRELNTSPEEDRAVAGVERAWARVLSLREAARPAEAALEAAREQASRAHGTPYWQLNPPATVEARCATGYYHDRIPLLDDYDAKGIWITRDDSSCTVIHKVVPNQNLLVDLTYERFGTLPEKPDTAKRNPETRQVEAYTLQVEAGALQPHLMLVGFAADEPERAKGAKKQGTAGYEEETYPLMDMGIRKDDEQAYLDALPGIDAQGQLVPGGFSDVKKSGCSYCKYQDLAQFWMLRTLVPETYAQVCRMEQTVVDRKGAQQAIHPQGIAATLRRKGKPEVPNPTVQEWRDQGYRVDIRPKYVKEKDADGNDILDPQTQQPRQVYDRDYAYLFVPLDIQVEQWLQGYRASHHGQDPNPEEVARKEYRGCPVADKTLQKAKNSKSAPAARNPVPVVEASFVHPRGAGQPEYWWPHTVDVQVVIDHVTRVNAKHQGTPRDAWGGMSNLREYGWRLVQLDPKDPHFNIESDPASTADVRRYRDRMQRGEVPPAIIVTVEGGRAPYWAIQDGAHRLEAARQANIPLIDAYLGTKL